MLFPRFKDVREDNDLTQKDLAKMLNTTEPVIPTANKERKEPLFGKFLL